MRDKEDRRRVYDNDTHKHTNANRETLLVLEAANRKSLPENNSFSNFIRLWVILDLKIVLDIGFMTCV